MGKLLVWLFFENQIHWNRNFFAEPAIICLYLKWKAEGCWLQDVYHPSVPLSTATWKEEKNIRDDWYPKSWAMPGSRSKVTSESGHEVAKVKHAGTYCAKFEVVLYYSYQHLGCRQPFKSQISCAQGHIVNVLGLSPRRNGYSSYIR